MRTLKRIASVKLTALVMGLAAACTLVSFLIPQRPVVGEQIYLAWRADAGGLVAGAVEAAGLEHVFTSWPFLIIVAVLAANLVACMIQRATGRARASVHRVSLPDGARVVPVHVEDPVSAAAIALRGWRAFDSGQQQWTYRSGQRGWWGSMVMHLGILLLILAGVVSSATRFSGIMVLAEGQRVQDAEDAYYSISETPRFGRAFTGAEFGLRTMDFTYDGDTIVDAVAVMERSGSSSPVRARVNYPFRASGKSYLLAETGLAAGVRVTRGEQVLVDGVVNLGKRVPEGYRDSLTLPDGEALTITAVPDRSVPEGARVRHSYELTDPVLRLTFGTEKAELAPGEQATLGDLTVAATGVRRWTSFNVRSDKGLPIAYVAFAMMLLGMIVRWLDPEVRLTVELTEDQSSARLWHATRYGSAKAERAAERVATALSDGEER